MWNKYLAHHPARILALVFCLGVFIGGSLPELGNLAVYCMSQNAIAFNGDAHAFNGLFLVLGLGGFAGYGFALYRRLAWFNSSASRVVKVMGKRHENER